MYLGIEIGGTKLQLGVGDGCSGELFELRGPTSSLSTVPRGSCSKSKNWVHP